MTSPQTIDERFWSKVDAGDCWHWTDSTKPDGYGRFRVSSQKIVLAHRWAYETLVGAVPEGLQLDHLCRNRGCVNPDHLEPVTQQLNMRRGAAGALQRGRTSCPNGHPYVPDNTLLARHGKKRVCRECSRARSLAYYYAHRGDR